MEPFMWWAALSSGLAVTTPFAVNQVHSQAEQHRIKLAENAHLPKGAVEIRTQSASEDRSGRIQLILVGTFAGSLGRRLLALLAQNGLDGIIGSILYIELDSGERAKFIDYLKKQVPVFMDRLEVVSFDGLPAGLGNADPDTVLQYIDRWGPPIITGTRNAVALHKIRQGGQAPGFGLLVLSLGGTAITGATAVKALSETLVPDIQLYGLTALPVDDVLRERFPRIREVYQKAGVRGFVLADNLTNEVANDFGMVTIVVGFALAAGNSDATVAANNGWYLMIENAPGHLVRFSSWIDQVPGYRLKPVHPKVSARYITSRTAVNSTILNGMSQVRRPQYDSLGGGGQYDTSPPRTSEYDIVLAAIDPKQLKTIEDDVVLAQQLKGRGKANYHLMVAPITTTITDPTRATCPVGVVWVRAVNNGPDMLNLLTGPQKRPLPPQLPGNGISGEIQVIYLPNGGQKVIQQQQ